MPHLSRETSARHNRLLREPRIHYRDFFETTTIHGLADFHKSNDPILKAFWGLAITCAALMAGYGWYAVVAQYRASPVVVSYLAQEANSRRLPDIVVCPRARFNQSYFDRYKVSDGLVEYIQSVFELTTNYPLDSNETGLKANTDRLEKQLERKLKEIGRDVSQENFSLDQLIDAASFSCSDIIQYCLTVRGIKNCCENSTGVMTSIGKCYRIAGPLQHSSGYGFGVTIVADAPSKAQIPSGHLSAGDYRSEGISVKLMEQGKGLDFDLTFIPTGTHTLMPLRAVKYEFKNDPPRYECLQNGTTRLTSALECFDDCFFESGMRACNCTQVTRANSRISSCTPKKLYGCFLPSIRKEFHRDPNFYNRCRARCKSDCTYWEYQPTVSFAYFSLRGLEHHLPTNVTAEWNKRLVLDIFYEKLEYTLIKHFASMTPNSFIANLGGQLSLWIGGSVISLIQLLIFLCLYPCSRLKKHQRTSTSQDSSRRNSIDERINNHNDRQPESEQFVGLTFDCNFEEKYGLYHFEDSEKPKRRKSTE